MIGCKYHGENANFTHVLLKNKDGQNTSEAFRCNECAIAAVEKCLAGNYDSDVFYYRISIKNEVISQLEGVKHD